VIAPVVTDTEVIEVESDDDAPSVDQSPYANEDGAA
jgi:hypothetical protein